MLKTLKRNLEVAYDEGEYNHDVVPTEKERRMKEWYFSQKEEREKFWVIYNSTG